LNGKAKLCSPLQDYGSVFKVDENAALLTRVGRWSNTS
jgi:hypothetical protein